MDIALRQVDASWLVEACLVGGRRAFAAAGDDVWSLGLESILSDTGAWWMDADADILETLLGHFIQIFHFHVHFDCLTA